MKNTLVIAWREIEERRLVPVAAMAFALLPLVLAAIPGIGGKSPLEAITVGSAVLSVIFTYGLAVILGASIVGRDLSEGRMSFYFSRPLGATSIWAGKVMAALILIALSFFLVGVPARFLGSGAWTQFWQLTQVIKLPSFAIGAAGGGIVLGSALVLFFVAHILGTFVRSRSPLIALDFVAAALCGVTLPFLFRPLLAGWARDLTLILATSLGYAFVIVLVCAGAWQLAHGRTDRKRNHAALSQFLWSSMAIALALGAAFVTWVVSAKPNDLRGIYGQRSSAGPWLALTGRAAGRGDYWAGFVINSETGTFNRIEPFSSLSMGFTRDGQRAFFLKAGPRDEHGVGVFSGEADLHTLRLGDKKPSNTGIVFKFGWAELQGIKVPTAHFFMSSDGSRIATAKDGMLSVYDAASRQSLGSVRLGPAADVQGLFVSPDVVRLYVQQIGADNQKLLIIEFNVRTKALETLGGIVPDRPQAISTDRGLARGSMMPLAIDIDSTATRMLVREYRRSLVTLCDARTGATIRALVNDPNAGSARFLQDDRIATIRVLPGAATLLLFSADGVPQREIALDSLERGSVVAGDGEHAVAFTSSARGNALVSIDLNSGTVERRLAGVGMLLGGISYAPLRPPPGSAALHEVIYLDTQNRLMAWNPATGATRAIIRG